MPKTILKGYVLPKTVNVDATFPEFSFDEAGRIRASFAIKVIKSEITVECDAASDPPADLSLLYMVTLDLVRAGIDLVSFSNGYALTVILDRAIDAAGRESQLMISDPALAALCTVMSPRESFDQVWKIVVQDHRIFRTLNDLINAVGMPHESTVNCGRVLESLAKIIGEGRPANTHWDLLRSTLNVDRPYVQLISDTSAKPRHGDRSFVPGATTTAVSERSWVLMNRFLEWMKRGKAPLPTSEFPTLHG